MEEIRYMIVGFSLMITLPSVFMFWKYFIYLEKTKQINLGSDKHE